MPSPFEYLLAVGCKHDIKLEPVNFDPKIKCSITMTFEIILLSHLAPLDIPLSLVFLWIFK
jgi:hypothetical protein